MTTKPPLGRPSKLTDELMNKAQDYADFGYEEQGDAVPSVAGLAVYLGVGRSTIYDNKSAFSDILEQIAQKQEQKLINGGLLGGFNATIVKMMLTKHGYSDKQVVDNTSSDGSMSPGGIKIEFIGNDN